MSDEDDVSSQQSWKGVHVGKGSKVLVPVGGLTIGLNEKGEFELNCTLHIGLNLCLHWLKIACNHLFTAEDAYKALLKAHKENNDQEIGEYLEREFEAGMQAMTAGAIAIDSYYATVKDYIPLPKEVTELWRMNKTARHKQVNEVFRQAFPILKKRNNLSDVLRDIFNFRDMAVHPSSNASEPVIYPEISRSVEWRHSAFCFQNARKSVMLSLQIVDLTTREPYPKNGELKNYCISARVNFEEVFKIWEVRYGSRPGESIKLQSEA